MAAEDDANWANMVRSGLYSVLVSRTGPEQRHAALCLTAAVLELVPSNWVKGPAPPLVYFAYRIMLALFPGSS